MPLAVSANSGDEFSLLKPKHASCRGASQLSSRDFEFVSEARGRQGSRSGLLLA